MVIKILWEKQTNGQTESQTWFYFALETHNFMSTCCCRTKNKHLIFLKNLGTIPYSPGLFCVHLVYLHFLYCYPVWGCSSLHKGITTRYMYLHSYEILFCYPVLIGSSLYKVITIKNPYLQSNYNTLLLSSLGLFIIIQRYY